MSKWKTLFVIVAVVTILVLAGFAGAALYEAYYHPHTVTVTPAAVEYLDTMPLENATEISWGSKQSPGSYYYNYTVYNNTTYSLNATIILENLPIGWSLTWANQTHNLNKTIIRPYTSAVGNLTLTIPLGASGTHEWAHWLYVAEAT